MALINTLLLSMLTGMGVVFLWMTNKFYTFITDSIRDHEGRIDDIEIHCKIERRRIHEKK